MATIKAVANLAGVSVGTVSHVITGSVPVSDTLKAKVQAAIRKLDYHPNHVARSLKTSRTRTLGILVPQLTIPFFPQVIRGAETAARQRGYSLLVVNSDDDADRQRDLLTLLRSQRVEGILLAIAAGPTPVTQIARMREAGVPVVCVDRVPDRMSVDTVAVEDVSAAELGVSHLIEHGYRRIAIVMGPASLKNERQRRQGYEQALHKAGLPTDDALIWESTLRPEEVTAFCVERLQQQDERRPDAIFATDGITGLGVLRALRESGLQTPADIGFVTIDELNVEDVFRPTITTVVQPACDIGFRAAELLLQRIADNAPLGKAATIRLPATLKVGESSTAKAQGRALRSAKILANV